MDPASPPAGPPNELDERLDSWKAIAVFLARDVRTVQRWERREGLPVHRHQHDKLSSVYAYRSELRAWQQAREVQPRETTEPTPELAVAPTTGTGDTSGAQNSGRATRFGRLFLAALVLMALAVGGWLALRKRPSAAEARLPAYELLVADPEVPPSATAAVAQVKSAISTRWLDAGGQLLADEEVRRALPLMRRSSEQGSTPMSLARSPCALAVCTRSSSRVSTQPLADFS